MKKTWKQKMDVEGLPKLEPIPERMLKRHGNGTMLIPSPAEVDKIMKKVPDGKLITTDLIMAKLAKKFGARIVCPMTTGIFMVIAANAADEQANTPDHEKATPYWRTLKKGGELNPKFPGGIEHMVMLLTCEGHHIVRKGARYFVLNYDEKLVK